MWSLSSILFMIPLKPKLRNILILIGLYQPIIQHLVMFSLAVSIVKVYAKAFGGQLV